MSKRLHLTRPAGLIALFVGGIGLLALSTGLLGLSTLPGASSDVQAQNVAQPFSASADAYVYSTKPTNNYATAPKLRVDASPTTASYLRFDVQDLSGPVVKATLSIFSVSGSNTGYDVHAVTDPAGRKRRSHSTPRRPWSRQFSVHQDPSRQGSGPRSTSRRPSLMPAHTASA